MGRVLIDGIGIGECGSSGLMKEGMIYGNMIGGDLGGKMRGIGSLGRVVWVEVLRQKGVKIS
ncbi:ArsB/NhaD family transporter, partial [Staphylococcus epidermidis]|uniref:ArsB/NhaD family transporter n=1 Tax=Staphylococcus epidermidis TaxID=1282 RepID=UPI0028CB641D